MVFLQIPSDSKFMMPFWWTNFACAYYKIVGVITSSENWSTKNLNNF